MNKFTSRLKQSLDKASSTDNSDQIIIYPSLKVLRIFDLDMKSQTYSVLLNFIMQWEKPRDEELTNSVRLDMDYKPKWIPSYRILNIIEENSTESIQYSQAKNNHNKTIITAEHIRLLKIFSPLDLRNFPVDTQSLQLELELCDEIQNVKFKMHQTDPLFEVQHNRVYTTDFVLNKHCSYFGEIYETNPSQSTQKHVYSGIKCEINLDRVPHYYQWNIEFIIFSICLCEFTSFAINFSNIENRLSLDFTLILTIVAFKQFISDKLPPENYLTSMDKYIMFCFSMLLFFTFYHAVAPLVYNQFSSNLEGYGITSNIIDNYMFFFTFIFWIISNYIYYKHVENTKESIQEAYKKKQVKFEQFCQDLDDRKKKQKMIIEHLMGKTINLDENQERKLKKQGSSFKQKKVQLVEEDNKKKYLNSKIGGTGLEKSIILGPISSLNNQDLVIDECYTEEALEEVDLELKFEEEQPEKNEQEIISQLLGTSNQNNNNNNNNQNQESQEQIIEQEQDQQSNTMTQKAQRRISLIQQIKQNI